MSPLVMFAVTTMVAFLVAATAAAPASAVTPVTWLFRADYNYSSAAGMFYKQHRSPASWDRARDVCRQEGAELAYPDTPQQREAFTIMQRALTLDGEPADMWLGIYAAVLSLKTVYEKTVDIGDSNNVSRIGMYLAANGSRFFAGFAEEFPFLCELSEEVVCNTSVPGYVLGPDANSCYKAHMTFKNWTEALLTCDAEGAQLTIINSQQEAEYLDALVSAGVNPPWEHSWFSIGFQELAVDGLYFTVDGHPLASSGYEVWSSPPTEHALKRCGSLINSRLESLDCGQKLPFVCEKKVSVPVAALPDCQRGTFISDVM